MLTLLETPVVGPTAIIGLVIAIAVLIFLVLRTKVHALIALVVAASIAAGMAVRSASDSMFQNGTPRAPSTGSSRFTTRRVDCVLGLPMLASSRPNWPIKNRVGMRASSATARTVLMQA